jgi:hypothetical protein
MKNLILVTTLMACAITAGAGIMPPNLTTPQGTTEVFLRALRDMDGEGVWAVMHSKLKDEFTKTFAEMKKNKEIAEIAEEFNARYLLESSDAHQFMIDVLRAVREAYPDECAELARMLSDDNIRSMLNSGKLEQKGNKAYLEIEELGSLNLIREGPNWKIAELDGFDIFDF